MILIPWANAKDAAEIIAAVGSTLAVGLLVWDRVKAKPLQISGYLAVGTSWSQAKAEIFLFSELGERLVLTSIRPSPHFEMALIPFQTPAARVVAPDPIVWSRSWIYVRAIAERGHSGDTSMFQVLVRDRPIDRPWSLLARAIFRPTLIVRGVLPYRQKGRFRQALALPDGDMLKEVRNATHHQSPQLRSADAGKSSHSPNDEGPPTGSGSSKANA